MQSSIDLVSEIKAAWQNAEPPPASNIAQPTYDDEGVSAYFTGKTWGGHSAKQLRCLSFAPGILTHEAFAYFLPAYMIADLEEPEVADTVVESLLFGLSSSGYDAARGRSILARLNSQQKHVLAKYVAFVNVREDKLYQEECEQILKLLEGA